MFFDPDFCRSAHGGGPPATLGLHGRPDSHDDSVVSAISPPLCVAGHNLGRVVQRFATGRPCRHGRRQQLYLHRVQPHIWRRVQQYDCA